MNTTQRLTQPIRVLTALALHQITRTLRHIIEKVTKPEGRLIPADAPVTLTTSPWFYRPNNLVIENQEQPVHAFPNHVVTLPGVTVVTTLDNSNDGGDYAHIYVLLNSQNDPWALFGRDEEGYFLDEDLKEVV